MYLAIPILLYACERLVRVFRSGYKSVKILKVSSTIVSSELSFLPVMVRIEKDLSYEFILCKIRLRYTQETYCLCICLNLKDSNTPAGNTFL